MLSREDDVLLLALSGPVLIAISVAVFASMPPLYVAQFLFLMILLGAVLALAGFAACIVSLISKKARRRPKFRYVMLGLLDLLFVCLTLIIVAISRSSRFG